MKRKRWSKYKPKQREDEMARVWWERVKDNPWNPGELMSLVPYCLKMVRFRGVMFGKPAGVFQKWR